MKKIVLVYSSIAGAIVSLMLIFSMVFLFQTQDGKINFDSSGGAIVGFTSMFLAMCMIFVAVKQYKTRYLGGRISFWKAWGIGLLIAFIASMCYVITWIIIYKSFFPDFAQQYADQMMKSLQEGNPSPEKIKKVTGQADFIKKAYSNVFGVVLITLVEIFPMGIVMSLISAIVFSVKWKKKQAEPA